MRRALILSLLFLTGCAQAVLKSAPPAPPEGSVSVTPGSLRASAIVELKKGVTVNGRAAVAVKSPDLLRIEVFGPLNQNVATIISTGTEFTVYSNGELRRFDRLDPYFPYSFTAEELIWFLTGSMPPGASGTFDYNVSSDEYGRTTEIVKFDEGFPVLKVSLGDYRTVSGAQVPFSISIEDGRQELRIRYSSVDINPSIEPDTFTVAPVAP